MWYPDYKLVFPEENTVFEVEKYIFYLKKNNQVKLIVNILTEECGFGVLSID